jgi:hypothetical protein
MRADPLVIVFFDGTVRNRDGDVRMLKNGNMKNFLSNKTYEYSRFFWLHLKKPGL